MVVSDTHLAFFKNDLTTFESSKGKRRERRERALKAPTARIREASREAPGKKPSPFLLGGNFQGVSSVSLASYALESSVSHAVHVPKLYAEI